MSGSTRFWVGASTTGGLGSPARGIRPLDVAADGSWRLGETVDVGENPMYLAWHGTTLAVAHELAPGGVSTWRIDPADPDRLLAVAARGRADGDPCHLAFGPSGRWVVAANYSGGSLTSHASGAVAAGSPAPAEAAGRAAFTGSGPDHERQEGPHLHQAVVDAARGRLLGPDLGADRIRIVELDESTGALAPAGEIHLHPGAGPRHLVVTGSLAIAANELDRSVSLVDLAADEEVAWFPVDERVTARGLGVSAIRLTRTGVVLVGDRDADALVALRLDAASRRLEHIASIATGGRHPRDLQLTHDERHALVADQGSDSIAVVALDEQGAPRSVVDTIATAAPACLARVPRTESSVERWIE